MIDSRKERGFSLVELGLVMALAALILLLGISALRTAPDRLGTKGAARALASLLSEASALARARNAPVAVGIPREDTPSELVLLSGLDKPRLEKAMKLSDFEGVTILPGTQGNDIAPELHLSNNRFDLGRWSTGLEELRLLVFLPSGEVQAQDIPLYQGRYHLLVSAGAETSGAEGQFTISGVAFSHTVSVGLQGDIRQSTGAGAAFGNPRETSDAMGLKKGDRLNFEVETERPVLEEIKVLPSPERFQLPEGQARVNAEGYLTLFVTARSPDGVPLVCHWTSESGGQLSAQESVLMEYDESLDRWLGRWHWRAPDSPGPEYTLICRVKDIHGQDAVNEVTATVDVEVSQAKQRLLFGSSGLGPASETELYSIYEDGSGEARLMPPPAGKHDHVGAWSPDGSRLVMTSSREGADELYLATADGKDIHRITFINRGTGNPEFSPIGTRIAFSTGTPRDIWVVNADGSNIINLTGGAYGGARLTKQTGAGYLNTVWSPNEEYLCFTDGSSKGHIVKSDGTGSPVKVSDSLIVSSYAWHPDSDTLALVSGGRIYVYSVSGAEEPTEFLPCDKMVDGFVQYSPDGTKLLFCSSGRIQVLPSIGGTCTQITGGRDNCASWIDNTSISFSRNEGGGNTDIYTVNLGGSGLTKVTDQPYDDNFYGWTPDLSGSP